MMHRRLSKTLRTRALWAALVALAFLAVPEGRAAGQAPFTEHAGAEDAVAELVTLKVEAMIHDRVVRLGDLFEGITEPALAETPVARAPSPGATVDIGARWLLAVARAHDLNWQPRSRYDRITLRRASHRIGTEQIETALRLALADRGLSGQLELALDNPSLELQLPSSDDPSIAVTGLSLDSASGRFIAHVIAPANGEPVARASVTGRAVMLTDVPVLRRDLRPGDVIRTSDIEWISMPVNRLTRGTVSSQDSLLGMSPRRPIRSQQLIRTTDLQTPVVVGKNSLVTIRLQTQRMQLTVQGRALENGAQGDVIRVMNTKSNSVVNAVVIDTGNVVVTPAATAQSN